MRRALAASAAGVRFQLSAPDSPGQALAQALPERRFTIQLWDGSTVPTTDGCRGPTFRLRSACALGHVLRAPGQLGLGRAYVSGELEVGQDCGREGKPTGAKLGKSHRLLAGLA